MPYSPLSTKSPYKYILVIKLNLKRTLFKPSPLLYTSLIDYLYIRE